MPHLGCWLPAGRVRDEPPRRVQRCADNSNNCSGHPVLENFFRLDLLQACLVHTLHLYLTRPSLRPSCAGAIGCGLPDPRPPSLPSLPSLAGRHVLELGCGLGLLGTFLYRIGASPLMLTDGDARTVANCCSNLRLNGVPAFLLTDPAAPAPLPGSGMDLDPGRRVAPDSVVTTGEMRATGRSRVQCRRLQWGPLSEGGSACFASAMPSPRSDVILGADLLYDPGE